VYNKIFLEYSVFMVQRKKIDPNKLKILDCLLLALINGATKAYVKRDSKKHENKRHCRLTKKENDDE